MIVEHVCVGDHVLYDSVPAAGAEVLHAEGLLRGVPLLVHGAVARQVCLRQVSGVRRVVSNSLTKKLHETG